MPAAPVFPRDFPNERDSQTSERKKPMGTFNFKSQDNDFPLYAMEFDQYLETQREDFRDDYDTEEEFEEAVKYDWDYHNWIYDELVGEADKFNCDLRWHKVSCEPGYYDGFQLYVDREWGEDEVLDEVWNIVVDGPEAATGNSAYPFDESPRYGDALGVLGNQDICDYENYPFYDPGIDYSVVSQDQVDEAYGMMKQDVSDFYQAEVDMIKQWLSDMAFNYGLGQITSNGWVVKWA